MLYVALPVVDSHGTSVLGGQAFVIKLRGTQERSSTSKILEPPSSLTHSVNQTGYVHWRHMKYVLVSVSSIILNGY